MECGSREECKSFPKDSWKVLADLLHLPACWSRSWHPAGDLRIRFVQGHYYPGEVWRLQRPRGFGRRLLLLLQPGV